METQNLAEFPHYIDVINYLLVEEEGITIEIPEAKFATFRSGLSTCKSKQGLTDLSLKQQIISKKDGFVVVTFKLLDKPYSREISFPVRPLQGKQEEEE